MFGDRIQDRGRGLGCEEGPDQEHGLDPVQARVQSVRSGSYLKTFYLTTTSMDAVAAQRPSEVEPARA